MADFDFIVQIVSFAADSLLRAGERPTIETIRARIGKGSPNTINPMLDAWWKTLSKRLDNGPAAFHRLPEVVAHVAESLWMHAQEEARRRIRSEHKGAESQNTTREQTFEVRSHVLTLREGELDSRLRDRDRTIEELNLRLRELTGLLRKEQATNESLARQLTRLAPQVAPRSKSKLALPRARTLKAKSRKLKARRIAALRRPAKRVASRGLSKQKKNR